MKENQHNFNALILHPIAHIHTDFASKFGIPRQGNIVPDLSGTIVFEKEYQKDGILKGLEDFSHIWLIWGFSESKSCDWRPTARPPRLGGSERKGVFACRTPHRPNPLALSAVKIEEIRNDSKYGTVIIVSGIDMENGSPIYDIKPYIPYSDAIPDALPGFSQRKRDRLEVIVSDELLDRLPKEKQKALLEVLAQDPRPAYQSKNERIYGFVFSDFNIRFQVHDHVLTVISISDHNTR